MVLLFGAIGFVNLSIPLTILLSIELFIDIKYGSVFHLQKNIYGNRMLILMAVGGVSLLWTPDLNDSLFTYAVVALTIYNSYLLYYFISKYNLVDILLYSVLAFSFINYSLALGLPLFNFLAFTKDSSESISEGWGWSGRFSGITPNPNSLAIMLIFSIFLSLYYLDNGYVKRTAKWIHFINILFGLYTIFLTQSKKGLIFSLLIILLFLVLKFSFKKAILAFVIICLTIYLSLNLGFFSDIIDNSLTRLSNMIAALQGTDTSHGNSTHVRLEYIDKGLEGFYEKPLLGHGFDSFSYYNGGYSHNNLVELLFCTGIIGAVTFYTIHLSLLTKVFKNRLPNILAAFLVVIVLMDTGLVSYSYKGTMLMLITCVILIDKTLLEKRTESFKKLSLYGTN